MTEIAATNVTERGETRADDRVQRSGDGGPQTRWLFLSKLGRTELLRLVTCGSVDDGKSTLIGRLLYDTKQIFVDQLEHIEDVSRRRGHELRRSCAPHRRPARRARAGDHDRRRLSLVRHAAAPLPARRRAGPCPVHAQHGHGRLDGRARDRARRRPQGRGRADPPPRVHPLDPPVPHVVVAVNKMDLVDFSEERFDEIGPCAARGARVARPRRDPDLGAARRQRRRALRACPGTTGRPARASRDRGDRLRPRLDSRRFPVQWVIRPMSGEHVAASYVDVARAGSSPTPGTARRARRRRSRLLRRGSATRRSTTTSSPARQTPAATSPA